jgi:hypothetical protein
VLLVHDERREHGEDEEECAQELCHHLGQKVFKLFLVLVELSIKNKMED